MACKHPPSDSFDESLMPWFAFPNKKDVGTAILFGHWAALDGVIQEKVIGLDTGCEWGVELTGSRWEEKE